MKYFRVKYGFGVMDFVTIEEGELKKVLYAQLKGTPVQVGGCVVNGKNIIVITPDYHKHLEWNYGYEPRDEQDQRSMFQINKDFEGVIEYHKNKMIELVKTNQLHLISQKEEMKQIENK